MRHNEIRDFTANIMTKVCQDDCIGPQLQELSGKLLHHATSTRDNGAHVDIRVHRFWGEQSWRSFFDVTVFNSNALFYQKLHSDLPS